MKKKGIYIVSEPACLTPGTGANKHIEAGLSQLRKYFDVELILFFSSPYIDNAKSKAKQVIPQKNNQSWITKKLKPFFKWPYLFIFNHVHISKYYKKIKKVSPDFIYERSTYLNFNGIIIAKLLRIPHMYEVNGILAHDHSRYFPEAFNKISFWLEKKAYKNTFGFYVGGINESFKIPANKSFVIQNGIDKEFTTIFKSKLNKISDKINLTFIGHAMAHHRLDILISALKLLSNPSAFRLHLIGSNLESIKEKIPDSVETIFYGSLSHEAISELMKDFHIGVITYALPYYSHVKTFMYGAAKLAVILPSTSNFKNIFSEDEVIFVKNADPEDISAKLDYIAMNPHVLGSYGEKIYKSVCKKFTWEEIYEGVSKKITNIIGNSRR
jgi:glycosyltransferase involved in cell wall biosynthesis